ncbi:MAG: hypothetical protein JXA30_14275 [Deltaproteobacteria bacterium]|nr:hypothetical protein [Deltaproteobacteria bacterium]
MNKIASSTNVIALLLSMTGCSGAVWGNLAIFAVSIGIFLGTLFLHKPSSQ